MKKRLLVIISILMIAAALTACGDVKPEGLTQEVYEIGCDALDIMEKYNNAEIDKDDAKDRISALYNKILNVPESSDWLENANKGLIQNDLFLFNASLGFNDGGTYDREKSLRDILKK